MLQVQLVGYCSPRCSMPWSPTALLQRRRPQTQVTCSLVLLRSPHRAKQGRDQVRTISYASPVEWGQYAVAGGYCQGCPPGGELMAFFGPGKFLPNKTCQLASASGSSPSERRGTCDQCPPSHYSVSGLDGCFACNLPLLLVDNECASWQSTRQFQNLTYVFMQRHASLGAGDVCHHSHLRNSGSKTRYRKYLQFQPRNGHAEVWWHLPLLALGFGGLAVAFHLAACMALGPKSQERGTYHGKTLQRVVGCLDLGPRIFFGRLLGSI